MAIIAMKIAVLLILNRRHKMDKKDQKRWGFYLYQPILLRILVDLRTLETEYFAPYQVQELFWPTLVTIFVSSPRDFDQIQYHIYHRVFPRNRYNLRFWTILDTISKIQIMQVELNRIGENVQRFFPRNVSVILKKESIETIEDFLYHKNLYELFFLHGTDIDSFDRGFDGIYDHLYFLSKKDAMKKTDYGERSTVEHITNVQKISRLKKMSSIFKFDKLKVSEFFGWNVYRPLTEAGLMTLKDVIEFEEIDTLIPQEHRREFHLKFSAVYYSFSFLEELKKELKKRTDS